MFREISYPFIKNVMSKLLDNNIASVQPMGVKKEMIFYIGDQHYFHDDVVLSEYVFDDHKYKAEKVIFDFEKYDLKYYLLSQEHYDKLMDKLKELDGELYWVNDIGILCGWAGYVIVKHNSIKYTNICVRS